MSIVNFLNPFSKYFLTPEQEVARSTEHEYTKNSQGIADDVDVFNQYMYQYGGGWGQNGAEFNQTGIIFDQVFNDKYQRIQKYRSMTWYPPCNKALNVVCDECIVENGVGKIASFGLEENYASTLKPVEIKQLEIEFQYIMNTVFKAKDQMFDLFKKWLVDGELFLEIVLSSDGKNVIGIKALPPFYTFPVYNEGVLTGFFETVPNVTSGNTDIKQFPASQVAYSSFGVYGRNKQDIRGYLEAAIRPYNQLKSIEDALVVYRLTRAPEKRMWNIETGRMTPAKAEEYVRKLMNKYKKRLSYDPETGAINSSKNIQSLTEDFWFPKSEGNGSTVDTLQGGTTFIGQLEDVQMFQQQLYDSMLIPKSRWNSDSGATYTAGTDIAREEYNFAKFTKRLQKRFRKVIVDVFIQQLRVRGYDKKYLDRSSYDIQMCTNNFFEEYKTFQLNEQRATVLNNFAQYLPSRENVNGPVKPIFSKAFVMEHMMLLNDEDRLKNQLTLDKEIADIKEDLVKNPPPDDGMGGAAY